MHHLPAAVALLGLVGAASAGAQAPAAAVPLAGSVRDVYTRDGYLPNATVTITSVQSGMTLTLATDADGRFMVPALQPGSYRIAVSAPGYQRLVSSNFCVARGRPAAFHAVLGPERAPVRAPERSDTTAAVVAVPRSEPSSGAMSSTEIEAAMAFGRARTKLVAPGISESGRLIRRRTARIFTPFWRVATMTQVAAGRQQPFTPAEIPRPVVEHLAWIVAGHAEHYVNDEGDMSSPRYLAAVNEIVIRPDGAKTPATDITPAWKMYVTTECDVEALESVLGSQVPRPGIVAAFPLAAISPGHTIHFTFSTLALPRGGFGGITVHPEVRRKRISAGDVRDWLDAGRR